MTANDKPLILVTNDDGISAPGIRHLITLMKTIGRVVVVAPDKPQSGMGHAITVNDILYCDEVNIDSRDEHREFQCSGTPVDCVKIATQKILDRKPDICVSGINHGSNSSINVLYSGTMSAAVEAGTQGIPAIGFSLLDYAYNADFKQASNEIVELTQRVLNEGIPSATVLNVNIPKLNRDQIKGVKVCRQANAHWTEAFEKRKNPQDRTYYWLSGEFVNKDDGRDTDEAALNAGYCSVVPVQFDLTAYKALDHLKNWEK